MTDVKLTPGQRRADDEVKLPNGVTLRRGSRVRVPKDLIWHPDVKAAAERYGWMLETRSACFSSEVLRWPDLGREVIANG